MLDLQTTEDFSYLNCRFAVLTIPLESTERP